MLSLGHGSSDNTSMSTMEYFKNLYLFHVFREVKDLPKNLWWPLKARKLKMFIWVSNIYKGNSAEFFECQQRISAEILHKIYIKTLKVEYSFTFSPMTCSGEHLVLEMEMVILGFHSQGFNVKMMQEKYFGLFFWVLGVFFVCIF